MDWLVTNWHVLLPPVWACIALTFVSVGCGAIVGMEREKREKPAGLRTLVMVCLGSAVYTMVSYAFGTTTGDTGRVAAQIVTGIGFLGAGVILHGRTAVSGITTAATIWATAASGIVIGAGYAGAGLGLSLLIRTVLSGIYWWEQRFVGGLQPTTIELLVDVNHGKTRFHLESLLQEFHAGCLLGPMAAGPDDLARVRLSFRLTHRHRTELLEQLANLHEVREIREIQVAG